MKSQYPEYTGSRWVKFIFLLACFMQVSSFSLAQQDTIPVIKFDFVYRNWNNLSGLPQNTVFDVHKDRHSNIWGVTEEGIFRFDGSRFAIFNNQNTEGIGLNNFNSIVEHELNIYTAGYQNLVKISKRVEKVWDLTPVLAKAQIRSLEFDNEGKLWIGTNLGQILYMMGDSIYSAAMNINHQIGSVEKLHWHGGKMYIGTSQGLYYATRPDQKAMEIPYFRNKAVTDIEPDSIGNIWIATSNSGLIKMNATDTINYTRENGLTENQINCLSVHRDALWIGLASSGFQIFHNGKFITPAQEKLRNQGIRSMHADEDGKMWMGSNSSGLVLVSDAHIQTTYNFPELSKKVILGIYGDDDGEQWVGSVGYGLYHIKGNDIFRFSRENGLSNNIVLSITGRGKYIYAGTNLGLNRIDKYTNTVDKTFRPGYKLDSTGITVLYKDQKDNIWIGVRYGGLYCLNASEKLEKVNLPPAVSRISIISAGEDSTGTVLFGTRGGGVIKVVAENDDFTVTHIRDYPDDVIYSFYTDTEGSVWTSGDKGLIVETSSGYKIFDKTSGLNFNYAYRMLKDNSGYIWLSGNLGMQRIREEELLNAKHSANPDAFRFRLRLFTNFDGMPNSETNGGFFPAGWKMKDGTLWYPTVEGIAIVDDKLIPGRKEKLDLRILSLKVGNKEFFPEEEIVLPPGIFNIEIHFSCYEFLSPDEIKYYVRLRGQNDWEYSGNRNVVYFSNLPHGDYIFEVRAEKAGIWSPVAALRFQVEPHFYESIWFKFLLAAFLASLFFLYFIIQHRMSRNKLKKQLMITRAQLYGQEKERQYISTELHDSISQQLATAKIYLEIANTDEEKRKELTGKSAEVIKNVMAEIRSLSHSLTPPGLKDIGLKEALEDLFCPYTAAGRFNIDFEYSFSDQTVNEELKFNLYRIAQEQIQNIDKYSNARNAKIVFTEEEDFLYISFSDDGGGSNLREISYGLGFNNIKNRLSLFGGKMEIITAPGNGFQLQIVIPKANLNN